MKRLTLSLGVAALLCLAAACSDVTSLRSDQPIQPVEDFEEYLIGNLMAGYVGTENCLKACHEHDQIEKDFQLSVHGAQIDATTGLPLVNCESCHG
ncbi:MAG: cytochrome C, partial [Desulfuromonadales bacterium]|nr:cytochrome C [Desulfuromonadales bacterium]NIR34191.1 cytochrome C [Desulfuromonadales bacterium]NIS41639.1 cytochrome C [Desulfuromonadales bacterium]